MGPLTRRQFCYILLSWIATASSNSPASAADTDPQKSPDFKSQKMNRVRNSPYAIECSAATFAHILSLLEMNFEVFSSAVDGISVDGTYAAAADYESQDSGSQTGLAENKTTSSADDKHRSDSYGAKKQGGGPAAVVSAHTNLFGTQTDLLNPASEKMAISTACMHFSLSILSSNLDAFQLLADSLKASTKGAHKRHGPLGLSDPERVDGLSSMHKRDASR